MPPKTQRRITLVAGEECTVSGSGLVHLSLSSGVLEVAGVLLEPNRRYPFFLYPQSRAIVVCTLEGGSGMVVSESGAPIDVVRTQAGSTALVQLVRRTLMRRDMSRVLVIGQRGGGKTLACHTICNLLHRHGAETEMGAMRKVVLVDLNCESNCLASPGTMTVLEVPNPKEGEHSSSSSTAAAASAGAVAPLWLGRTNAPTLAPMSWYTGSADRPSTKDVNAFLFFSEQVCETAVQYLEQELRPPSYCLVMDAPSPKDSDLKEGVFYKKLIEVTKPTHVVIVGRQDDESDNWTSFLQEDVQRILPDCDFVFHAPLASTRAASVRPLLLHEYFVGTPDGLLGCSKVVLSVQSVQFVRCTGGRQAGSGAVTAEKVTPTGELNHVVCALSHAELIEEVPLAPIAGLVMVSFVDGVHDEVVLIVPADQDPLLRRFIVAPNEADTESLRLSDADIATIEEYVVP